jgi:hypothetical protein
LLLHIQCFQALLFIDLRLKRVAPLLLSLAFDSLFFEVLPASGFIFCETLRYVFTLCLPHLFLSIVANAGFTHPRHNFSDFLVAVSSLLLSAAICSLASSHLFLDELSVSAFDFIFLLKSLRFLPLVLSDDLPGLFPLLVALLNSGLFFVGDVFLQLHHKFTLVLF